MSNLICRAAAFAFEAHQRQRRDYSGQPYFNHVARVAGRVAALPKSTPDMVAAAYLHDVVEDTDYTIEDIRNEFGNVVAGYVEELTNVYTSSAFPDLKRLQRKERENSRLAVCSEEAQQIKLIDRIDNVCDDNRKASVNWVMKYIIESEDMAKKLDGVATGKLVSELRRHLDEWKKLFSRVNGE